MEESKILLRSKARKQNGKNTEVLYLPLYRPAGSMQTHLQTSQDWAGRLYPESDDNMCG
jgi:hypothetical protein